MRFSANAFWTLDKDTARAVVRLARSAEPFDSTQAIHDSLDPIHRALASVERDLYGLLVDMRRAPLRNDPAFETAMAEHRKRLVAGFRACALLVNTVLGKLQLERLSRADSVRWAAFDDEAQALEHVRLK